MVNTKMKKSKSGSKQEKSENSYKDINLSPHDIKEVRKIIEDYRELLVAVGRL